MKLRCVLEPMHSLNPGGTVELQVGAILKSQSPRLPALAEPCQSASRHLHRASPYLPVALKVPFHASQQTGRGMRTEQAFVAKIGERPPKAEILGNHILIVEVDVQKQRTVEFVPAFAIFSRRAIVLDQDSIVEEHIETCLPNPET